MKRKGLFAKGLALAMAACLAFGLKAPVVAKDLTLSLDPAEPTIELCEETTGTLIFEGDTNVSYESSDASWLMNAADEDVITVVYTCTVEGNAGWGVLGWGATIDDVWKDGPSLSASETNATDTMVASMTVAEFKKTMGITDSSVISFIKLGAWNGGKIVSLTVSSAEDAPKVEGAEEIVLEAPKALEGDYLYIFEKAGDLKIYPNDYCLGCNPGTTMYITVELESNGPFSGGMGICVNNWAWQQNPFESDEDNTCTIDLFITPLQDCFQFQIWWMGGTQVGIKSITVEKAIDYRVPGAAEEEEEATRDPYAGNANASFSGYVDLADASWWTEKELTMAELLGNVDPATVTSIVFNGETSFTVGYNSTTVQDVATGSAWKQTAGMSTTVTDAYLVDDPADTIDYAVKLCLSKGDSVAYRLTWDVYTNGATPAVDPSTGGGAQTPSNTATASYVFDPTAAQGDKFVFDLNAMFPQAQVGDTVDVTLTLTSAGGWFGGGFGFNDETVTWTQQQVDALDTQYTATVPILYAAGTTAQVEQWWVGGADVTATVNCTLNQQ